MIPETRLYTFTTKEAEAYDSQSKLSEYQLRDADDELDSFTNHSQHHVTEVMRECERLYNALKLWYVCELPDMDDEWARDHLLLAAKLHDIGLCGTPEMHSLLKYVDELYTLLGVSAVSEIAFRALCADIKRAAQEADINTRAARDLFYWLEQGDALNRREAIRLALSDFHGDVKTAVRKRHASTSAHYIMSNAREIKLTYGESIDIPSVALMAALHSDSSSACERVVCDGEDGDKVLMYMRTFLAQYMGERAASAADARFKRVTLLAALLRLADTRRSGSRMYSLEGCPIRYEIDSAGRALIYKYVGNTRVPMPTMSTYERISAEICCEFGDVRAFADKGIWRVEHHMTMNDAHNAQLRQLFGDIRLNTYARELETGAMAARYGFKHVLKLELRGLERAHAQHTIDEWNKNEKWAQSGACRLEIYRNGEKNNEKALV